jgi:hypothetical protein
MGCLLGLMTSLVMTLASLVTGLVVRGAVRMAAAIVVAPFKLLGFVLRRRRRGGPPASHGDDGPGAPR